MEKQVGLFFYVWEWEIYFEFIYIININGQLFYMEYDFYFFYDEEDFDELVLVGYYEKISCWENKY